MKALPFPPSRLLTGATDAHGRPLDLLMADGRIVAAGLGAGEHPLAASAKEESLSGWTLLPPAAEAHAHLDKTLLGMSPSADGGDLQAALTATRRAVREGAGADLEKRARTALRAALGHGFTSLRSHVDVGPGSQAGAVEALHRLRQEATGVVDLQLVALVHAPDPSGGPSRMDMLEEAMAAGCDAVGGAPWLGPDPEAGIDELTAAAAAFGCPIDLHLDETVDPRIGTVVHLARRVEKLGLGGSATASHCVSLGQRSEKAARSVARLLADVGVSVVVLPQTNLYLQGRDQATCKPRGIAPLQLLEEAGVTVAAGGDNWRDPFNPLGRIDPFETAALLVAAGHSSVEMAYAYTSSRAREVMGLAPIALGPGEPADLLAVRASDLGEALASATEERVVWRRGEVVARTTVNVEMSL